MFEESCDWLHSFEPNILLWDIPERRFSSDSTHNNALISANSFLKMDLRMDTHDFLHACNIRSSVFADYIRCFINGCDLTRSNIVNWRSSSDVIMDNNPVRRFRPEGCKCNEAF